MKSQADMNGRPYFKCFELFLRTAKELPDDMRLKYYDALMDYWIYWIEPSDPIIKSLLTSAIYSIDKSDEIKLRQSQGWKNHKWNQYTKWDEKRNGSWEAQKKAVEVYGSMWNSMEDNGRKKYRNIEIKEIKKDKEKEYSDSFEKFWKEFPHARKWKKNDSYEFFVKQDSSEVMKQVWILKWKLKAWLEEWRFIPACERWIRDFTPLNDDVVKQDLVKICEWHMNEWWDVKARSQELKQTFWEQRINEIVKAIQQKNSPKNLFLKQNS